MESAVKPQIRVTTTTDGTEAELRLSQAASTSLLGSSFDREVVQSFYWWDGCVQNDEEFRLSFATALPINEAVQVLTDAHNYDVPMIISELPTPSTSNYWKGLIQAEYGGEAIAQKLVALRCVACAQMLADGSIAVKTTSDAKPLVESITTVTWIPITGNEPYLKWLDEETKAAI